MLSALYRYVEAQTTTNWTQTSRDKSWYWWSSCLHPCAISSIYNISYRQQGGWKASSAIHDLVVGFITDHAVFARRHRVIEKNNSAKSQPIANKLANAIGSYCATNDTNVKMWVSIDKLRRRDIFVCPTTSNSIFRVSRRWVSAKQKHLK